MVKHNWIEAKKSKPEAEKSIYIYHQKWHSLSHDIPFTPEVGYFDGDKFRFLDSRVSVCRPQPSHWMKVPKFKGSNDQFEFLKTVKPPQGK